jgi:hypothetical protein
LVRDIRCGVPIANELGEEEACRIFKSAAKPRLAFDFGIGSIHWVFSYVRLAASVFGRWRDPSAPRAVCHGGWITPRRSPPRAPQWRLIAMVVARTARICGLVLLPTFFYSLTGALFGVTRCGPMVPASCEI